MSDFLRQMADSSRERADSVSRSFVDGDFDHPVYDLNLDGFEVIAEIKDRSPAEGDLAVGGSDKASRAGLYASGGATAISVLTEPSRFSGSLDHLAEVVAAVPGTAVMRKDFLVDTVQVLEARAVGASGVLLIATMLDDATLRAMLDCAWEYDLFVLLESFDEEDLERSARLLDNPVDADRATTGKLLFGVNTRNLRTLEVDGQRLQRLGPRLPDGFCVAESGLKVASDAADAAGWGYSLALVGTALMRSDAPDQVIAGMRSAGSEVLSA